MNARLIYTLPIFTIAVVAYFTSGFSKPTTPIKKTSSDQYNRIPILLFHNIDGEGRYAISRYQFREHLEVLKKEKIQVLSLKTVYEMLETQKSANRPSVVITIDDDYKNIVRVAAPMLREYQFSATFFVYTQNITNFPRQGMAWDDLRRLQREGFDIQNHSHTHTQFQKQRVDESFRQYEDRVTVEIVHSKQILEKELGQPIWAFSYPFGYSSPYLEKRLRQAGYKLILTTDANAPDTTKPFTGVIDRFTIQRNSNSADYSASNWKLFYHQIEIARQLHSTESVSYQNDFAN
ncbi:MAG: polysaccharide deacetylase family protein [Leptonema sp. (in: Bacteria)]|nr:polysaccharide deacetylase family protein [Leptonema sp. (in: bacteria)]